MTKHWKSISLKVFITLLLYSCSSTKGQKTSLNPGPDKSMQEYLQGANISSSFGTLDSCKGLTSKDGKTKAAEIHVTKEPSEQDIQAYKKALSERLQKEGVLHQTFQQPLSDATVIKEVFALDKKQPEKLIDLDSYINKTLTKTKINKAKQLIAENFAILDEIEKEYNIDKELIVALWGVETNFGTISGKTNTVSALFSLALEGRRRELFENELVEFFKIIQTNRNITSETVGSWAGAIGQTQFMPSSFSRYAVDYNKDSIKDIFNTKSDIFASIANYLQKSGWVYKSPIIVETALTEDYKPCNVGFKIAAPIKWWEESGVYITTKEYNSQDQYFLVIPDRKMGERSFLVSKNYLVLLKWNRSMYFATAVARFVNILQKF